MEGPNYRVVKYFPGEETYYRDYQPNKKYVSILDMGP